MKIMYKLGMAGGALVAIGAIVGAAAIAHNAIYEGGRQSEYG